MKREKEVNKRERKPVSWSSRWTRRKTKIKAQSFSSPFFFFWIKKKKSKKFDFYLTLFLSLSLWIPPPTTLTLRNNSLTFILCLLLLNHEIPIPIFLSSLLSLSFSHVFSFRASQLSLFQAHHHHNPLLTLNPREKRGFFFLLLLLFHPKLQFWAYPFAPKPCRIPPAWTPSPIASATRSAATTTPATLTSPTSESSIWARRCRHCGPRALPQPVPAQAHLGPSRVELGPTRFPESLNLRTPIVTLTTAVVASTTTTTTPASFLVRARTAPPPVVSNRVIRDPTLDPRRGRWYTPARLLLRRRWMFSPPGTSVPPGRSWRRGWGWWRIEVVEAMFWGPAWGTTATGA